MTGGDDGLAFGLFVLAALLLSGPVIAFLMYFYFGARPATRSMKVSAAAIMVALWLCVDTCLYWGAEYTWNPRRGQSLWASLLFLVVIIVPLFYVAAYVGCLILALLDRARVGIADWLLDPPEELSSFYSSGSKVATILVAFPLIVLAMLTLAFETAHYIPASTVLSVTLLDADRIPGPADFQFTRPQVLRLNETSQISFRKADRESHPVMICTLTSPGIDLEPVPIGRGVQELLSRGNPVDSPDCLWLATPRQTGTQTLVLRVSVASSSAQSTLSQNRGPDIVDIESLHVVGRLFTFPVLLAAVLGSSLFVGCGRLFTARDRVTLTNAVSDSPKPKIERVKVEVESKLYSGETKVS